VGGCDLCVLLEFKNITKTDLTVEGQQKEVHRRSYPADNELLMY
jgi:hypothetical protein